MAYYALFVSVLAILLFLDARRFDWSGDGFTNKPWKWAIGALIFWPIVIGLYLMHRRKTPRAGHPA